MDPNSEPAHHWFAEHWLNVNKVDRALAEMERARELDPLSLPSNAALARVYRDVRRYAQAVEQCRKTLDLDANTGMGQWCLGEVYIGEHLYARAIPELEVANRLGTSPIILRDLAWVHAAAGNGTFAERDCQITYLALDAEVDPLRSDPIRDFKLCWNDCIFPCSKGGRKVFELRLC